MKNNSSINDLNDYDLKIMIVKRYSIFFIKFYTLEDSDREEIFEETKVSKCEIIESIRV